MRHRRRGGRARGYTLARSTIASTAPAVDVDTAVLLFVVGVLACLVRLAIAVDVRADVDGIHVAAAGLAGEAHVTHR